MFNSAPTQYFVPREVNVAFQLTSLNQDLPDWFMRCIELGKAKFDECGHLRVHVITGKAWVVELGQYVMRKASGDLYIMDELDFLNLYKEA